ncbi:LysR family transcriptional regulator [Rhodovulum sp. 12E13]|uniref:LysR family transcriptional regulator n=1 Tax=Rhodovulum sp. 12E13 TaxID=2203891 RepID=UPI000E194903|nr:LysR family transcriptional regulator [Rhodovulum sp. 12E13]RDC74820.1 LysR family transcriptional regulator [Rhodovulum sp. 12E13]
MAVDTWDEIRTAFHVARMGTVSGAAEALGVHHATVIRHVDALEARLGTKLFQRHARGYTPTEAGQDLLRVAATTEDQFTQLIGRIKGQGAGVTGDLIVTSLPILSPRVAPALVEFMEGHPDVSVRFLSDERLYRLEYGEAHVAIRAGARPEEPDNVVQHFFTMEMALYATGGYLDRHGPVTPGEWAGHRFVSIQSDGARAPFYRWMHETIPADQIRYRASRDRTVTDGVEAGAGIGFMPVWMAEQRPGMVQVAPPEPDCAVPVWLVTHVDLHRTAKVQTLVKFLKDKAGEWGGRV